MLIGFLCFGISISSTFFCWDARSTKESTMFLSSVIVASLQHINYGCHIPLEMKRWASPLENPKSQGTISDKILGVATCTILCRDCSCTN